MTKIPMNVGSTIAPGRGLTISGLNVDLGGRRILDHIDLDIPGGSWLGLVGPNGAGKSTFLRALLGLVPSTGEIHYDGMLLRNVSVRQRARLMATVPQQPIIPGDMTVSEYVLLGRSPHIGYLGTEGPADLAAARGAAAALDLTGFDHRPLQTLSGGETQRAILARALAQEAPVLLLDEPTTSLDIGHQQSVLELVAELRANRSLTVISSLHDLTLAAQFCDELALLSGGRIASRGRAMEVLTKVAIGAHFHAEVDVVHDDGRVAAVIPLRRARSSSQRDQNP